MYNLSISSQGVLWPALKTDQNTWPGSEILHINSLLHIISPCQISPYNDHLIERYWLSKMPYQNCLQQNMLENNKTWGHKNSGISSLSQGEYKSMIWAYDE